MFSTPETSVHVLDKNREIRNKEAQVMRSVTRATEPIIRAHRRRWLAANDEVVSECFQILARYFHDTRDSLNFVGVRSCSQNLISCMSA